MGITKGINYGVEQVLQSGSTLVITWGRYYTVRQLLQSSAVQKANKRNGESNRIWQPTPWCTYDFPGDRQSTPK